MIKDSRITIILIGGCSGTGKTRLAPVIANHFGYSLGQTDDYRMALQSITNPYTNPELHYFIKSPGIAKEGMSELAVAVLVEALISVNMIVSKALQIVIEHHIATENPIILEGDAILPELAAKYIYSVFNSLGNIRAVFLNEPDKAYYFRNIIDSTNKTDNKELQEQLSITTTHWLYGKWITREVSKYNLPLVPSRPWDTLVERVLNVCNKPTTST